MREDGQAEMPLHTQCGIPVIKFAGDWDETKPGLLSEVLNRLAAAGHYEIILDLTGAKRLSPLTHDWFASLEQLARGFRLRRGRLGAVVGREQVDFVRQQSHSLVRWATTEEEAICFLKGVPHASAGAKISAHWNHS